MQQQKEIRSKRLEGRIVWVAGDLFKGEPQFDDNKQPIIDPQTGKQVIRWSFGLAVRKDHPCLQEFWNACYEAAYEIYTNRQLPSDFSFKVKDGDGLDHKNEPFSKREGYAGHWVFSLSTQFPIPFFIYREPTVPGQLGRNEQVDEGIKCGDYVEVFVNIKAHGPIKRGKPGLYLNPIAVRLTGYGKPIVNTPSVDTLFGTNAPVTPPGASPTPIAPSAPMPMGEMGQPPMPGNASPTTQSAPPAGTPGTSAPVPGAPPQPPVQPYHNVLPPQFHPQQQPVMSQTIPMPGQPPMENQMPSQGYAPGAAPGSNSAPSNFPAPGAPPAMPQQTVGHPGYPQQQ